MGKLVSFGDSFTFGQGSSIGSDFATDIFPKFNTATEARIEWKRISNSNAYTKFLADNLGMDSWINLGIPGASNKRIYTNLRSYCENNDISDSVIVVALTSPDRDYIATPIKTKDDAYVMFDFYYSVWDIFKSSPETSMGRRIGIIEDVNHNTVKEMMYSYFNNFTVVSNHIITHNAISDYLKSTGRPYIIIDILNDVPYCVQNYMILDKLYDAFPYEINKSIGVDLSDFSHIKDYQYELQSTTTTNPYLNYYTLKENYKNYFNTDVELNAQHCRRLSLYMIKHPQSVDIKSKVPGDNHWSDTGHKIFADLLTDWIRKKYGDIK